MAIELPRRAANPRWDVLFLVAGVLLGGAATGVVAAWVAGLELGYSLALLEGYQLATITCTLLAALLLPVVSRGAALPRGWAVLVGLLYVPTLAVIGVAAQGSSGGLLVGLIFVGLICGYPVATGLVLGWLGARSRVD